MKKAIFFALLLSFGFCCVSNVVANFDASCKQWSGELYGIQNQLRDVRAKKNISYVNAGRLETRRADLEERIGCHCKNEPFIDKYKIHIAVLISASSSVYTIIYSIYTMRQGLPKTPQAFEGNTDHLLRPLQQGETT